MLRRGFFAGHTRSRKQNADEMLTPFPGDRSCEPRWMGTSLGRLNSPLECHPLSLSGFLINSESIYFFGFLNLWFLLLFAARRGRPGAARFSVSTKVHMTPERCSLPVPVHTECELEESATSQRQRDNRERAARRLIKASAWAFSLRLTGP